MSKGTVLAKATTAALVDWNDDKMQLEIKKQYGEKLTETEWNLFLGLGKATGLNPFLREIWAVKYGTSASIFVGRDGYRRSAQNHPEYEYHYSAAVYDKDSYKIVNGEVVHEFNLSDRGSLVGAYCVVKRKSATRAAVNFVEFKEYKQAHGVWTTKPVTMIIKVAEAQGLRAAFQELFAGTYEESENWKDDAVETTAAKEPIAPNPGQTLITDDSRAAVVSKDGVATPMPADKPRRGRPAKNATAPVLDVEVVPAPLPTDVPDFKTPPTPVKSAFASIPFKNSAATEQKVPEDEIPPEPIRADQIRKMHACWSEYRKLVPMDEAKSLEVRRSLIKDMFKVESSTKLSAMQADEVITRIQALVEMAAESAEDNAQAEGEAF